MVRERSRDEPRRRSGVLNLASTIFKRTSLVSRRQRDLIDVSAKEVTIEKSNYQPFPPELYTDRPGSQSNTSSSPALVAAATPGLPNPLALVDEHQPTNSPLDLPALPPQCPPHLVTGFLIARLRVSTAIGDGNAQ